jgi:hypothetical protein
VLAWALWLVTFGCCAAGLLVTLAIYRPLTLAVLAEGALYAFFFVLGFATVGLVLALRRPAIRSAGCTAAPASPGRTPFRSGPGSTSWSASTGRCRSSRSSSRRPGT